MFCAYIGLLVDAEKHIMLYQKISMRFNFYEWSQMSPARSVGWHAVVERNTNLCSCPFCQTGGDFGCAARDHSPARWLYTFRSQWCWMQANTFTPAHDHKTPSWNTLKSRRHRQEGNCSTHLVAWELQSWQFFIILTLALAISLIAKTSPVLQPAAWEFVIFAGVLFCERTEWEVFTRIS